MLPEASIREVGSDIRLPERKRLNVTSWPHVRGQIGRASCKERV